MAPQQPGSNPLPPTLIVHIIYANALAMAGLIGFDIFHITPRSQPNDDLFFTVFAAIAALGLVASIGLIGKLKLPAAKAAIVRAAMGETCAFLGLVYYILTGDRQRPFFLMALCLLHYFVTMRRYKDEVEPAVTPGSPNCP